MAISRDARPFWLSQLGEEVFLASKDVLNIRYCLGQTPQQRIIQFKMSIVPRVEKPCYKPLYKSKLFLITPKRTYVTNKIFKYLASEIN